MSSLPHRQPASPSVALTLAHAAVASPAHAAPPYACTALASTSLKWGHDGELSAVDLERILERLAAVDPVAEQLDPSQFRRGSMGPG